MLAMQYSFTICVHLWRGRPQRDAGSQPYQVGHVSSGATT